MPNEQPIDVVGYLQDQPVNVGKGALVAGNLLRDKGAHATKARQIKALRLVEHKIGDPVRKAASKIPPPRMLLFFVVCIDHLLAAALGEGQQALHLRGRVL